MTSYASKLVDSLRSSYFAGKTKPLEYRRRQLMQMIKMLEDNRALWAEALHKDIRKPWFESELAEILFTLNELKHAHNELANWIKPEKVKRGLVFAMDDAFIQREPFGVTLIIGAWNYPLQLTLGPLVGAIAAGNCAIVKPSELSPATAELIAKLVPTYLDEECYSVVCGGVPETTELLELRFDHIFYTGSSVVGKIVMAAAAKNLTPVVLELGGKSPVFVDEDVDLFKVARSICWGKYLNCGQTCVAPDYVLCKPATREALVEQIKLVVGQFYDGDAKTHGDYPRIVNERHFDRISRLIDAEKVVVGGGSDKSDLFIEPTVMTNVTTDDAVMKEEIFGPLLPIVDVNDAEEAVDVIKRGEKPLALYCFTNNKKTRNRFINDTSSGGCCINDVISHMTLETMPFGGVGGSGTGGYHGWYSYDCFSHKKSVMVRKLYLEPAMFVRYPPYSEKKMGFAKMLLEKSLKSSWGFGMICLITSITLLAFAAVNL